MKLIVASLAVCLLLFSCVSKDKKTSEIPDRREFPVNSSVNPCNDFFEYACSGAISKFKLREDRSRHIFSFSDSRERILEAKKVYLGGLQNKKKFNQRSQQLHDYYASCMDEKDRSTEEKNIVATKLADMKKIKSHKAFGEYLTKKSLIGEFSHIAFGNIENLKNSDIYDFIIMPSRMTSMPEKSYYKKKDLMKDFKVLATDFYKTVGMDKPEKRAQWATEFETKFINLYPDPATRRKLWTMNKYIKKTDLIKSTPNFNLKKVIGKVPAKTRVRNPMDNIFTQVNDLMGKYTLDQLKGIYLWLSLQDYLDVAYPEFFKKKFAFENKYLGGPPKRPDLAERCTTDVMGKFAKEIDAEMFDKFFPNFPEKKFIALLEKVRTSILEGLKENKWLTLRAKANAIKKIKAAKFQVVKPKNKKEWDFNPIAKYSSKTYLGNGKLLAKNITARDFRRLGKPVDKTIWAWGPMMVNAYYDPTANKFVMPAGILQYPFYDPTLPEWVNLGAVGAVVGHELGHGVDDQGSKYDEKGKVRQWMSKKDLVTFRQRGEKLIKQFDSAGHNGKLTLGENIGDLVGVTFAYDAAKKVIPKDEEKGTEAKKQFFLQWARAWCGVMRPKAVEMRLKTDPHAMIWARVNEQMKHQPDFAKVYQCKAGDKLVLPEKDIVRIW